MQFRRILYGIMGVCIVVVVFGLIIWETIWESNGSLDTLSWKVIFINFIIAILLILSGCSMILDYWHLLDVLGEYFNFYPPITMFRIVGVITLLAGLLFFGVMIESVLTVFKVIPNTYTP